MRLFVPIATAISLFSTACLADQTAPLAPGKPAGLQKAQTRSEMMWGLIGAAAVVGVAVLIAEDGSSTSTTTATTAK